MKLGNTRRTPKGRRTNLVSGLGNLGLFPTKRPDLDSVDDNGKQAGSEGNGNSEFRAAPAEPRQGG